MKKKLVPSYLGTRRGRDFNFYQIQDPRCEYSETLPALKPLKLDGDMELEI